MTLATPACTAQTSKWVAMTVTANYLRLQMEIVSCQVYSGGDVRETRPLLNVRLSMRANHIDPKLVAAY